MRQTYYTECGSQDNPVIQEWQAQEKAPASGTTDCGGFSRWEWGSTKEEPHLLRASQSRAHKHFTPVLRGEGSLMSRILLSLWLISAAAKKRVAMPHSFSAANSELRV